LNFADKGAFRAVRQPSFSGDFSSDVDAVSWNESVEMDYPVRLTGEDEEKMMNR
jgi:hypothetical protein